MEIRRHPRKWSLTWQYFKDLGYQVVYCKLCGKSLKGNKDRHLQFKHPLAYDELMQKRTPKPAVKFVLDRNWFRKYMTKLSKYANRCNVCKTVIKYCNFKRHLRVKHKDIYDKECSAAIIENQSEEEKDSTGKDEYGQKSHMCKLCGTEIQGNMFTHLKHSHPLEYFRSQQLGKLKEKTITASRYEIKRRWVKEYSTQISARTRQCDVCKKVLILEVGSGFGNMIRHFKLLHPAIYAEVTQRHSDSDSDIETEGKVVPSNPSDRVIRGWVKKYCKKIGERDIKCNVCKQVIRVSTGYSNMIRHFKSKHNTIYLMERNQHLSSNDEDINEEKEPNDEDEETQNEVQEYIIEYLIEETPAENSDSAIEQEQFTDKPKSVPVRSWVRKYMNKVGDDDSYECVICNVVLKLRNGKLHNMERHMELMHSFIYKSENESLPDSSSVNEEKSKETENIKKCGDGAYVIEEVFLGNESESVEKDSDVLIQDEEVQESII